MNSQDKNLKEMEELAMRFCSKIPNETNFNNNKTRKYFSGTHHHTFTKGTISSSDTIKMSYKTCRRSKYSLFGTEKSINFHTISKAGTLKTENDKDISNIQNFYIVTYDKTSTKKEAFKLQQKNITDDIEVFCRDDPNGNEEEEILFEEDEKVDLALEEKKLSTKQVADTYHSSVSTQNESIQLGQKYEYFMQIEQIYQRIQKEIEDKKFDFNSAIESWFVLANNNSDLIFRDPQLKDESILQIVHSQIIMEIIILGLLYGRIKLTDQLMNGIKNCFFYLHQNFVIILFILVEFTGNIDNEAALSAKKKVDENRTWLNKHIYKKLFVNNINLICGIVKNLISSLKLLEENNVEENSNLDVVTNFVKQFNYKNPELRDSIPTLREYMYINFVQSKQKIFQSQTPKQPYLPTRSKSQPKYTLVLDLDETLVHYVEDEESAYILIRPGAENFLEELHKWFELVIFTAATQDYADFVLNELDKNNRITHRLYRQHTFQNESCNNVKDLSRIGRDLSKVLIIDNVKDNFQLQPENGLHIKDFYDDVNDTELIDILPELLTIVKKGSEDLRKEVIQLRKRMEMSREYAGEENKKQLV